MKRLSLILAICWSCTIAGLAQSVLRKGTKVPVKLVTELNTKVRETPKAVVAEDVLASDGKVAVKQGTPVGLYYDSDRARACGAPGRFALRFESTLSVNKIKVPLDCNSIQQEGKDRNALAICLGYPGVIIWPLLPCLLIKGHNIVLPEGTTFDSVFVEEDVAID